ncbi:glycosyltransferase family 2 protein [Zunongwangia sp. SCSIO 43204]|uniref:glycosyltransferase family 2 protein n=1 Tax=Zunongwangia sp. SCSIO 43204 TaxID=2779359 RepID=UPI001CAA3486|nr:glycosyltransferase family 2 protein [Zunongwangia sp. SCSIO 43204]UAB84831.1 glycosyltransferase family 2 protein [Zunongwangia sp. SCSIO 43204]
MFSVIIPLYNKEHTIAHTIQTVLNQTYPDFEIIVVNDGTTDNSVQKIEELTDDKRVRIINQINKGVSAARNTGIIEAQNDWLAFLDADDEWESCYLEYVVNSISKFPKAGMIVSGRCGQSLVTRKRNNKVPENFRGKVEEIDFFENPHVFAHISATVVKKDNVFANINTWGGFIEGQRSNEDFVFLFRNALHTKVVYSGFALAIYNGDVEGQTTSMMSDELKLQDSILFHNKVIEEWIKTKKASRTFKIFMKYEIRHIWSGYLQSGNYDLLSYFIDNMHREYYNYFSSMERKLLLNKSFNKSAQYYILFTKIIWRSRGYPVVK